MNILEVQRREHPAHLPKWTAAMLTTRARRQRVMSASQCRQRRVPPAKIQIARLAYYVQKALVSSYSEITSPSSDQTTLGPREVQSHQY